MERRMQEMKSDWDKEVSSLKEEHEIVLQTRLSSQQNEFERRYQQLEVRLNMILFVSGTR